MWPHWHEYTSEYTQADHYPGVKCYLLNHDARANLLELRLLDLYLVKLLLNVLPLLQGCKQMRRKLPGWSLWRGFVTTHTCRSLHRPGTVLAIRIWCPSVDVAYFNPNSSISSTCRVVTLFSSIQDIRDWDLINWKLYLAAFIAS